MEEIHSQKAVILPCGDDTYIDIGFAVGADNEEIQGCSTYHVDGAADPLREADVGVVGLDVESPGQFRADGAAGCASIHQKSGLMLPPLVFEASLQN